MKAAFWAVGFAQYMRKRKTKTLHNMGSKDANRERVKKMLAQAVASSLLSLVRGERVWDRYPQLAPNN